MKHWPWLAPLSLFLATPWGGTAPTQPWEPKAKLTVSAFGTQTYLVACKAGERTVAIASRTGKEAVLLALYAYDPHGNCIARDEYNERSLLVPQRQPATDDSAVEWFPPAAATYTVEARNQSAEPCLVRMAIR